MSDCKNWADSGTTPLEDFTEGVKSWRERGKREMTAEERMIERKIKYLIANKLVYVAEQKFDKECELEELVGGCSSIDPVDWSSYVKRRDNLKKETRKLKKKLLEMEKCYEWSLSFTVVRKIKSK